MDVAPLLEEIRRSPEYAGQLRHIEILEAREGEYAEPEPALPSALTEVLAQTGIERLYGHQERMLRCGRAGRDAVVVSGTASGKTLCYNLPILEACLADPAACALYLYPTKALAQDQRKGLSRLVDAQPQIGERVRAGVFDGDTPTSQRRRIKAEANLVLSNPDMLHASILPYHPKWSRFFAELRYVVIDEIHMYRGIFGAHVACVLRRLERVCNHYGASPTYLAASATIANPGEHADRLLGRSTEVIDQDGSPRGRKYFALWNPTPPESDALARQSAADDAVWLMKKTMEAGGQSLAFTRTRQAAELINRYVQQAFREQNSPLADRMRAYRGGYLPEERRKIEQQLADGTLRGIASTNALELGVDIGSLDVSLLVQYPGTIASAWQQAGRSGRRQSESLAILIAGNDPVDQYLLRHPEFFFKQSPEHAVVDPENPYVLANHLRAAAFELPLGNDEIPRFGSLGTAIADLLADEGELSRIGDDYYFAGGQNPAHGISLRHMSDNTFSIVQLDAVESSSGRGARRANPTERVIANVDSISAPELVYPEAIYLHDGEPFLVRELDLNGKVAYVERRDTDYYTQAVLESRVKILRTDDQRQPHAAAQLGMAQLDVSWKTVAFKKIKFETRENIGFGPVDIPEQHLPTTGFWLTPQPDVFQHMKQRGFRTSEGLCGLRNLAVVALPMVAMCDSRDISGVVDSQNRGRPTIILYDRYPGGLGYCEKGYQQLDRLLEICDEMVRGCGCEDGCPSCVGLPNLRPAIHSDPDLTRGYPIPDKAATLHLLSLLRPGIEPLEVETREASEPDRASEPTETSRSSQGIAASVAERAMLAARGADAC